MLLIASCSEDAADRDAATLRDSAGIAIVTNTSPALQPGGAWAIAEAPDLVIGGEGDSTEQLFRVRGVARLQGGVWAIANGGTSQILMYDLRGELVRAFGREGSGPGEFSSLDAIWAVPGDSILAWDGDRRVMQLFDAAGRHVRTVPFSSPLGDRPRRYPDGTFVGFTSVHDTLPRSLHETWWESYTFVRFSPAGDSIGALGPLPGIEYMASDWEGTQLRARRPLGHAAAMAVGPDVFYYGSSDGYRILAFEPDGRLRRIIERSARAARVTEEIRSAHIRERLGTAPDPSLRAAWEQYYAKVPWPAFLPAYRRFEVDPEGNLWVQEWDVPGNAELTWSVFSAEGRWITDVRSPRGEALEVGVDHLTLLVRDALGVERVAVYPIEKQVHPTRR